MLKYEHLEPGTFIRAYDYEPYEGVTERYIEGKIIRHGVMPSQPDARALVVECEVDTTWPVEEYMGHKYTRVGEEVFVPMQMSDDYDGRVRVIVEYQKEAEE